MRNSIKETQKLFQIEDLKDGQVSIKTSEYLLSLIFLDRIYPG